MKIAVSWSSGKDSAWMLHVLRQQHPGAIGTLLTTTNEAFDRVAMHAVRRELVEAQAQAARLPLHIVPLPWPCPNDEYERRMAAAVATLVADGFTHMAFGDLFLEDVRRYREERLAGTGLTPVFPLWKTKSTAELAREMVGSGLRARLTCIDPRQLDARFAGRAFDAALLDELPDDVDPCGENGEFHSFACAGPMFDREIRVVPGPVVERDGFVFADLKHEGHEGSTTKKDHHEHEGHEDHDRATTKRDHHEQERSAFPSRIVCLTEETTETLYLLGEGDRVVGVSGYTVRPPEARQKPRVSSFLHARFEKIEALRPDLILAFSDLQADITTELVKRGYSVFTFNQRSVAEILQMIRVLGGIVGVPDKAAALVAKLEDGLESIRRSAAAWPRRPRVYFEEWDDPLIGGIRWVEELTAIAGGDPIFPEHRDASLAKDRIVSSNEVIARAPDIIIGSWCGKPVRVDRIRTRPGWDRIPAVQDGHIYEVKSSYILQPGPAALTEGVTQLASIIGSVARGR